MCQYFYHCAEVCSSVTVYGPLTCIDPPGPRPSLMEMIANIQLHASAFSLQASDRPHPLVTLCRSEPLLCAHTHTCTCHGEVDARSPAPRVSVLDSLETVALRVEKHSRRVSPNWGNKKCFCANRDATDSPCFSQKTFLQLDTDCQQKRD